MIGAIIMFYVKYLKKLLKRIPEACCAFDLVKVGRNLRFFCLNRSDSGFLIANCGINKKAFMKSKKKLKVTLLKNGFWVILKVIKENNPYPKRLKIHSFPLGKFGDSLDSLKEQFNATVISLMEIRRLMPSNPNALDRAENYLRWERLIKIEV